MLGDISPQTAKVESQTVTYPGHDLVTMLKITRYDGRRYTPVDLSSVLSVKLVFPTMDPVITFDSTIQTDVFSMEANGVMLIDLAQYDMPESVLPCHLVIYDAEHPFGQVLVDDQDLRVQFDFRLVDATGGVAPPVFVPANALRVIAGETISALKVVYEMAGLGFVLDYQDADHIDLAVGVAITSAVTGGSFNVQRYGVLVDSGWTWTPGPVYLGADGAITQVPPVTGFRLRLGAATSATQIIIDMQEPIDLG